jgi:hypothetical protein
VLLRLAVVVAEQMQDPVRAQEVDLVLDVVLCLRRLLRRHLRADHHVTEERLSRVRVGLRVVAVRARLRQAQLVHREGQHVGGTLFAHPAHVQLGHRGLVHEQDRKLGQRVHAHSVQHMPGQVGKERLIDVHPRLVGYLNGHQAPACGDNAVPCLRRS